MRKPILCPNCKAPGERIDKWDAYACLKCNLWIEPGCDDPKCDFCADRPEKPSP